MPKNLWHPHNVFQYINQNSIYMHQKRKLCAYVLNTTQPTQIMWMEHTEILLVCDKCLGREAGTRGSHF